MAEPALTRADPSGAVAGTTRPVHHTVQDVRIDDGSWGYCEVLATARDITGRWRIQLLWYDAGPPRAQREDWYLFDRAKFREPAAPDAERAHPAHEHRESGTEDQDVGEDERGHSGHHGGEHGQGDGEV